MDRASEELKMSPEQDRVVIGMDPHKGSVTIEVMAGDEAVLGGGRFATDRDGFRAMLAYTKAWPNRVWAIEMQRDRPPCCGAAAWLW
jgi:hypothetical protein